MKRKYFFIVYFIALGIAVTIIEFYIYNKKERLRSDMYTQIEEAFPMDDEGNKKSSVETLNSNDVEDIEYQEIPIPAYPEGDDRYKKKYWKNKFQGVQHLYKLDPVGWDIRGKTMSGINHPHATYGVQEYLYFPYMIGVSEGAVFNEDIAKGLIKRTLDHCYRNSKEYKKFVDTAFKPNEYYENRGVLMCNEETILPYNNETIGCEPIYEGDNFTGCYWYNMFTFGPYKVLLAYRNTIFDWPQEREGFCASVKDRIILYGIAISVLTLLFFLYSNKHN